MSDITSDSLAAAAEEMFASTLSTNEVEDGQLQPIDETVNEEIEDGEEAEDDDSEGGEGGEGEPDQPDQPGDQPDDDEPAIGVVRIGNREISAEDAEQLVQLQELLSSDPNFQQHLYRYFAPPATEPVATEPATTPADPATPPWQVPAEYLDNPAFKALYDINAQQWELINNLKSSLGTIAEQNAAVQRKELEATANNVASSFASDFKLSDTELADLRTRAAKLNVVPNFINEGASAQDAFRQALELAYWSTPEYRSRDLADHIEAASEAKKKKARAASISGSAGSAPRTAPKPKTEQEKRAAMIDELAGKWSG